MEAFETDAKKEAWYRKELKYVVNRADVILEVPMIRIHGRRINIY